MRDSCTWKIGRTKTFRLGSSKILGTYGGNIQNIEKSMREVYLSDGWTERDIPKLLYYQETSDLSIFNQEELDRIKILIQTDEDGADARIVAYECQPKAYRQLFIHGIKSHVFVGMHLFADIWEHKMNAEGLATGEKFVIADYLKCPIQALKGMPHWKNLNILIKSSDDWDISERYYYLAKQTCHSANYDIQAPTFRMNVLEKSGGKILIDTEESVRFLEIYNRVLFPEIPERNREVMRQGRDTGVLYNMFGHPYYITSYSGSWTENTYKEWYSWSPQSTVGMIINVAVARFQENTEKHKLRWDILANGHDSMISQVPLSEVMEGAAMSRTCVEQEFESPVDSAKFFMRSETKVGFNWAPYHKTKNPLGLKEIKV